MTFPQYGPYPHIPLLFAHHIPRAVHLALEGPGGCLSFSLTHSASIPVVSCRGDNLHDGSPLGVILQGSYRRSNLVHCPHCRSDIVGGVLRFMSSFPNAFATHALMLTRIETKMSSEPSRLASTSESNRCQLLTNSIASRRGVFLSPDHIGR